MNAILTLHMRFPGSQDFEQTTCIITTGRRLFKGKNEIDTIQRIVEKPYPQPTQLRKDYPPDLEAIVMKGLARERDERYANAREMGEALDEYIRDHKLKVTALEMSRFMEDLFKEKLAEQRELMKEGKKLADIVAEQEVEEITEMDFLDMTNIPTTGGTPGAPVFPTVQGADHASVVQAHGDLRQLTPVYRAQGRATHGPGDRAHTAGA